jgi:hypothetical protein
MKHILFILLSFLSVASYGQGPGVQDSTEIFINNIRAEYQKINSTRMRVVDAEAQEESSEGGEVKKYYDDHGVRKIVADYAGETGRASWEFYFTKEEELCFVFVTSYFYDRPLSGKVVRKEENRYYFHHRRMIRWIDEKGKVKDRSLYADKAREILNDKDIR